jgi:hypothetical protein
MPVTLTSRVALSVVSSAAVVVPPRLISEPDCALKAPLLAMVPVELTLPFCAVSVVSLAD